MKRRHTGSCHCRTVRFEAEIDLTAGTSRCNCSICAKSRFWKAIVPASDFRLLAGGESLADYAFDGSTGAHIHHRFCGRCGVKVFGQGSSPQIGGVFHAINVACLDDVGDEELATTPVKFENGRDDDWQHTPAETRHL